MARGKGRGKDRHGPGRLDADGGDGPTWLTTYADAITLLMAFFVILYAMSQVDQVKFEKLLAGFAEPFGNDTTGRDGGNISLLASGAGLIDLSTADRIEGSSADPFDQLDEDPVQRRIEEAIKAAPATDEGAEGASVGPEEPPPRGDAAEPPDTGLPLLDVSDLERVRGQFESALVGTAEIDEVDFDITGNQLVISISSDDVLFRSGSAVLEPRGREVVAVLAPVLNDFANTVEVVGHTDDRPLDAGGYTNWNLSGDRALAVLDVLRDDYGVDARRLGYRGYGEQRPRVPNDSAANRAQNRRVELVIVAAAGEQR